MITKRAKKKNKNNPKEATKKNLNGLMIFLILVKQVGEFQNLPRKACYLQLGQGQLKAICLFICPLLW
jgi:hypothetical protein